MNLDKIIAKFDLVERIEENNLKIELKSPEVYELITEFGSFSIHNAAFRIHTFDSSAKWTELICETFSKYKGHINAFGFDWKGRQYAKNLNKDITYMCDIATGEDFILEQKLTAFFEIDLVEYADDTLSLKDFDKLGLKDKESGFEKIIGFKVPLWLGGKDSSDNYEIINSEVNWAINQQLMSK